MYKSSLDKERLVSGQQCVYVFSFLTCNWIQLNDNSSENKSWSKMKENDVYKLGREQK